MLSVCIVILLLGSKDDNTDDFVNLSLIMFKANVWLSVHYQSESFFNMFLIGAVNSEKFEIKLLT